MSLELIRGWQNIQARHQACVATIGNFDGVHRGHQAILAQVVKKARAAGLPSLVITFEPLPQEYFKKSEASFRLMRLRDKLLELSRHQVDRVLCLHFNQSLAMFSAAQFIENLLVQSLKVQHLVVGDDFRFGYQRQGDFVLLQQAGLQFKFSVEKAATVEVTKGRISSSGIRCLLAQGDISQAAERLGHPYTLQGKVKHGEQRGRLLGFPTANVHLAGLKLALHGVYAVRIHGIDKAPLPGVANIGIRPTFAGKALQLEVHILDFNKDIYGKNIGVEFCHKIRDEIRFETLEDLQTQIKQDVIKAQYYLAI